MMTGTTNIISNLDFNYNFLKQTPDTLWHIQHIHL